MKEITFNNSEGDVVTYDEVCGRLDGKCEVWGRLILTDDFWDAFEKGTLIFPFWDSPWGTVDLSVWLGSVNKWVTERITVKHLGVTHPSLLKKNALENRLLKNELGQPVEIQIFFRSS